MLAKRGVIANGKEVKNMTYAKPELVPMVDARIAIQSSDGSDGTTHEKEILPLTDQSQFVKTTSAYEADE